MCLDTSLRVKRIFFLKRVKITELRSVCFGAIPISVYMGLVTLFNFLLAGLKRNEVFATGQNVRPTFGSLGRICKVAGRGRRRGLSDAPLDKPITCWGQFVREVVLCNLDFINHICGMKMGKNDHK